MEELSIEKIRQEIVHNPNNPKHSKRGDPPFLNKKSFYFVKQRCPGLTKTFRGKKSRPQTLTGSNSVLAVYLEVWWHISFISSSGRNLCPGS